MSSDNLSDVVDSVVADFVNNEVLFTALDVSNKVKETLPFARHREVRDQVRQAWFNDISTKGYGRTPITVNLSDGSTAEALLYHPLVDSWDLDNKYDAQQRAKTTNHLVSAAPAVTVGLTSVSVSDNGTITSKPVVAPVAAPVTAPVTVSAPVITKLLKDSFNAKDLWANMFNTQPSLFPRK